MPHNRPRRLQRSRRRGALTPPGAIYVGRPTIWCNPFGGRNRINHARSVILHRAWLEGHVTDRVMRSCGFTPSEAETLCRWRRRILARARIDLGGRHLECWCPLTSPWCHADTLLKLANH